MEDLIKQLNPKLTKKLVQAIIDVKQQDLAQLQDIFKLTEINPRQSVYLEGQIDATIAFISDLQDLITGIEEIENGENNNGTETTG